MTRDEYIVGLIEQGETEAQAIWLADLDDEWFPSIHEIIRRAEQILQEEEEYEYEAV